MHVRSDPDKDGNRQEPAQLHRRHSPGTVRGMPYRLASLHERELYIFRMDTLRNFMYRRSDPDKDGSLANLLHGRRRPRTFRGMPCWWRYRLRPDT